MVIVVAAMIVVALVVVVVKYEVFVVEVDVVVVVISAYSMLPNTLLELFTAVIFVLMAKHWPVVST